MNKIPKIIATVAVIITIIAGFLYAYEIADNNDTSPPLKSGNPRIYNLCDTGAC